MQVRKLKDNELWHFKLIDAVAFESPFDWEHREEKNDSDPNVDVWAAFDGDTPCAGLAMSHFLARFDGHIVGLGGVGGVASLPANRRGGSVRACIQAGLEDLYAHGDALSALYPFSTRYYQQFGYRSGVESHLWHVPMDDLPQGDFGGKMRQLFPGDDLGPLLRIYHSFYEGCNLSVERTEYDKELTEKDLMKEKRYIYLWEDENGLPGAFCIVGRDGDELNARTDFGAHNALLFRDARSLQALLSFLRRSFSAYYKTLRFSLPSWAAVGHLLPECANLQRETFYNGMVRAVNVEKLLGLCRCKGTGMLTVQVDDPMLKQNNATFLLDFREGRPNQVQRSDSAPDITLGPGRLGALLCGVHAADELRFMPDVQVHNGSAPYESVFYPKPCHLTELF